MQDETDYANYYDLNSAFFKSCLCLFLNLSASNKKCFDCFRYHNHLKNIGQYSLEKFHMIL